MIKGETLTEQYPAPCSVFRVCLIVTQSESPIHTYVDRMKVKLYPAIIGPSILAICLFSFFAILR